MRPVKEPAEEKARERRSLQRRSLQGETLIKKGACEANSWQGEGVLEGRGRKRFEKRKKARGITGNRQIPLVLI